MSRPSIQLILLDGATGAGKSSLLKYLRDEYSEKILVGTKLTTRRKRVGDNEWEFRFVEHIPEQFSKFSFKSVGNEYAVNHDELAQAINRGLIYIISCDDRRTMEKLKSEFKTVIIYVYRSWTEAEFSALLASRGTSDQNEAQFRRDEIAAIAPHYLEKIMLYDYVILNIGSNLDMVGQLSRILHLNGVLQKAVPPVTERKSQCS